MNSKIDHHNNKSHKAGYHPYRQDRRDTNQGSRSYISNDRLTAKYYIHPYSLHNRDNACLQKPEEIGTILSQSKTDQNQFFY